MRITPLDVRKQEFNKSMRGFDCDEVRAFLSTLADEYETVLIDNKQIRERVMEQDDKISGYQDMERTLRDTLMTAERVMQDTRETAGREGELIIQEAQMKAKNILEECRLRTEELRREIIGLRKEKETYLARFRGLAEAQIQFVDTHISDFDDLDQRLVNIVDNVVSSTMVKKTTTAPIAAATVPNLASTAPMAPQAGIETTGSDTTGPEMTGPMVAPTLPAAPAVSENDIWRDYDPGQKASESFVAEATAPTAVNEVTEETVAGSIADIVSESLAETAEEAVETDNATEALNVDVISNGQVSPDTEATDKVEVPTQALNI